MSTPTHSQPSETAKQKRAKARVMFASPTYGKGHVSSLYHKRYSDEWTDAHSPVAVIPTATRKQAQQIVRWANLSREQKVEAIAKAFFAANRTNEGTKYQPGFLTWKQQAENVRNIYRRDAAAILSAIESTK